MITAVIALEIIYFSSIFTYTHWLIITVLVPSQLVRAL